MKLLFCQACRDVVQLHSEDRSCICGGSHGRYVDEINVEYSGPCVVLGILNRSLIDAVAKSRQDPDPYTGKGFTAFVIAENCERLKRV